MAPLDSRMRPELLDAAVRLMGSSGKSGTLPVVGESMVPTLAPGALVAVGFRPGPPKFGEIAVFRNPAPGGDQPPLVVHRFLGRTRFDDGAAAFRFRGDGVPWLDAKVAPGSVLGCVYALRDGGGWWDLRGFGPRWYGRLAAAHDLFWSAVASRFRGLDRVAGRWGVALGTVRWIVACDRLLLNAAHTLCFTAFHRRTRIELDEKP